MHIIFGTPDKAKSHCYTSWSAQVLRQAWQYCSAVCVCVCVGVGAMTWSPLACGIITGKYDNGIPDSSRASMKVRNIQRSRFHCVLFTGVNLLCPLLCGFCSPTNGWRIRSWVKMGGSSRPSWRSWLTLLRNWAALCLSWLWVSLYHHWPSCLVKLEGRGSELWFKYISVYFLYNRSRLEVYLALHVQSSLILDLFCFVYRLFSCHFICFAE